MTREDLPASDPIRPQSAMPGLRPAPVTRPGGLRADSSLITVKSLCASAGQISAEPQCRQPGSGKQVMGLRACCLSPAAGADLNCWSVSLT